MVLRVDDGVPEVVAGGGAEEELVMCGKLALAGAEGDVGESLRHVAQPLGRGDHDQCTRALRVFVSVL